MKNAKNGGILGLRERSHLNCGLSFFVWEGSMKKSKKAKPRPAWTCEKCKVYWISCRETCMICGGKGAPQNEGAVKICGKNAGDSDCNTTNGKP